MECVEWFRNKRREHEFKKWAKRGEGDPFNLKGMTLEELCVWIGQWPVGSANQLFGCSELNRRNSEEARTVARISMAIALASLLLASLK